MTAEYIKILKENYGFDANQNDFAKFLMYITIIAVVVYLFLTMVI